jgi:hypothetical protein
LTCDCSLVTVIEDEDGNPLDVGRKRRTVTTALKRALWSRDRGCTFPGCRNKRYVEAHHIRHWANGGATRVENLALLCSQHHTLLHEGGFSIRRGDDGEIRFARGDGRLIPRCGYRLEDMQDDYAAIAELSMKELSMHEPSTDAYSATVCESEWPEVRESVGQRYQPVCVAHAACR